MKPTIRAAAAVRDRYSLAGAREPPQTRSYTEARAEGRRVWRAWRAGSFSPDLLPAPSRLLPLRLCPMSPSYRDPRHNEEGPPQGAQHPPRTSSKAPSPCAATPEHRGEDTPTQALARPHAETSNGTRLLHRLRQGEPREDQREDDILHAHGTAWTLPVRKGTEAHLQAGVSTANDSFSGGGEVARTYAPSAVPWTLLMSRRSS